MQHYVLRLLIIYYYLIIIVGHVHQSRLHNEVKVVTVLILHILDKMHIIAYFK